MGKAGQPTKWKPRFNQDIIDFFTVDEPYREHEDDKSKIQLIPAILPLFENFAHKIGVNGDTLVEWAKEENKKKYPGFSAAYARAKQLQQAQLVQGAIAGAYAPQFSIFLAKNITNMRDESTLLTPDIPKTAIKGDIEKMTAEAIDQALANRLLDQKNKKLKPKR